jgi:hypothetical protein
MAKKKSHKGGKKGKFKIWWIMLIGAIICWVMFVVMIALMFSAMANLSIGTGNIFGILFGTIGAYAGVIGAYSMWLSIFMWLGIGLTISTIVLAVLEKRKK